MDMTLHKTEHEARAAGTVTVQAISAPPVVDPIVIPYAAFEISQSAFDELTQIFRSRGFDHVFDTAKNCIFADLIAFTRAPA
jgi:hypothetical protein